MSRWSVQADVDRMGRGVPGSGAQFLTEPLDREGEIRCYMRDPDGYLIEVGQTTAPAMLDGVRPR